MRERAQMRCRQMAIRILDQVQEFDQQITTARARAQQRLNLAKRGIIEPATFRSAIPWSPFMHRHVVSPRPP
jgi:hypothetical protein